MNGRVETRFEILHPIEGLIATALTRSEAMQIAEEWASGNTGYLDAIHQVNVFDSMAHRGQASVYAIVCGQWEAIIQ